MVETLDSVPTDELVKRFCVAAQRSVDAKNKGATAEGNDQAAEVWDISVELHRRNAQIALLTFLKDKNPSVRLSAAADALYYAPQRAEPVLTELTSYPDKTGEIATTMLGLWREGQLPSPK